MFGQISLPVWIFGILSLAAAVTFYQYMIYPVIAAYLNARMRMTLEEVNPGLQLKLSQFSLTRRHVLADRLANDDEVEAALDRFAQAKGLSKEQIRRETWRIAWDIVPAFNPYFYFRLGYRMARSCLRALYKLRIAFSDGGALEKINNESAVIFIINHRSNVDYAVANFLTARRTMLSFGVGEWSRLWPIQPFMRMAGGYFVRRNSNDPHYRFLLKRYVQLATHAKVPHAIFLEGKLSNDGSVSPPKVGILSYVTEGYDPAKSPDIVLVPIGMNYDHVIEDVNVTRFRSEDFQAMGRGYIIKEGLQFLYRMTRELLWPGQNFGIQCSNFGAPVSFQQFLHQRGIDWTRLDRAGRFEEITALGDLLVSDLRSLVPATPMSILARSWFEDPLLAASEDDLRARFMQTAERLAASQCHIEFLDGPKKPETSFDHALKIAMSRGMLTRIDNGLIKAVPREIRLLNYYGNSISQHLQPSDAPPETQHVGNETSPMRELVRENEH